MTGFINLLASDVWTEFDIINRTEAMIASEFPKVRFDILMRKVDGRAFGYVLTEQEQADLQRYQQVAYAAGAAADAARADMALLQSALDFEAALARLLLPLVTEPLTVSTTDTDGVVTQADNPAIAADLAERAAAQALIDGATQATLDLVLLRAPPPVVVEPVPEFLP